MTTKTEILRTIKLHCINCFGGNPEDAKHNMEEVKNCAGEGTCLLWPYRLGEDPKKTSARIQRGKHVQKFNEKTSSKNKDNK